MMRARVLSARMGFGQTGFREPAATPHTRRLASSGVFALVEQVARPRVELGP